MDLRHNQLPWSDQIWAKINADLAQALAQSRRVRAPFEVFHVPTDTQTVMRDQLDSNGKADYSETDATPILQLSVDFLLRESQVFNEGGNFFALDRIVQAAYDLGYAEDWLLMQPNTEACKSIFMPPIRVSASISRWEGLYYNENVALPQPGEIEPISRFPEDPERLGLELFNYVVQARTELRKKRRYEPYALMLSEDLEGELHSTIRGSNSLNTPIERMRPLVTAGIHSTPALPRRTAVVVCVARAWVDIAQAMEPSVQFVRINDAGHYEMRLVERFAFRLKDPRARVVIEVKTK